MWRVDCTFGTPDTCVIQHASWLYQRHRLTSKVLLLQLLPVIISFTFITLTLPAFFLAMLAMSSGSPFLFPRLPLVLTPELEAKVRARVRKFPGHEPISTFLALTHRQSDFPASLAQTFSPSTVLGPVRLFRVNPGLKLSWQVVVRCSESTFWVVGGARWTRCGGLRRWGPVVVVGSSAGARLVPVPLLTVGQCSGW